MALDNLLSSIKLGNVEIANRTAMAPMAMGEAFYVPDEKWSERVIRYFEERAIGGVGLLNTGFVRATDALASQPIIGIYNDGFIDSHSKLVERVHKYDSKIFIQLGLQGGKWMSEAPSSVYSPNYPVRPRELTTGEVEELIKAFIDAAGRGLKAGYDGVEIHGGHTYLIGAMMSPALNIRTDKFGGSFEKRMRFAADIIKGIKDEYPGYPVGFKFSAWEELDGGVDIKEGENIARYIADLDIAYLHVSSMSSTLEIYSKYASVPPMYIKRNTLMPLTANIKKLCPDTVVMAAGSITVPEEADEFIASGKCDMVALGRTILADPHWVKNAREKKHVVSCIRCNVCYNQLFISEELACSVNPYLLHEAEKDLPRPVKIKDVTIIGAGPAGIRCALTASARGHKVTLYEKKPYIGGMLFPGSQPDCKKDVSRMIDWLDEELERSKVKLILDKEVTPEALDEEKPDALVIATGSNPIMPDIDGMEKSHVFSAVDILTDISKYSGKKAVVIGGGDVGCETACHLADNGFDVTIVEMLPDILNEALMTEIKLHMIHLLDEKNIKVMTSTKVNRIIDEGVEVILPNSKMDGLNADIAAFAVNLEADAQTIKILSMKAEEVYVIGDALCSGRIREAIKTGEDIGRRL